MVSYLSNRAVPRPSQSFRSAAWRSPFVLLVLMCLLVGAVVWTIAISGEDAATDAAACPISPEADAAGLVPQTADALDSTVPAPLEDTSIRVLNANGESGQAGAIAARLAERGFRSAGADSTGNDPVYPGQDLTCHGQIRYGENGAATARSLSLVAPCMELVTDARSENTVDLVLGTFFSELSDSPASYATVDALKVGEQPSEADIEQARSGGC